MYCVSVRQHRYTGSSIHGQPIGPPVVVSEADHNGSLALSVTDNGVVMIVERLGIVSGYLTNGIVHARWAGGGGAVGKKMGETARGNMMMVVAARSGDMNA
jgi:hypothetical protein